MAVQQLIPSPPDISYNPFLQLCAERTLCDAIHQSIGAAGAELRPRPSGAPMLRSFGSTVVAKISAIRRSMRVSVTRWPSKMMPSQFSLSMQSQM
jgi:hypothetical protein